VLPPCARSAYSIAFPLGNDAAVATRHSKFYKFPSANAGWTAALRPLQLFPSDAVVPESGRVIEGHKVGPGPKGHVANSDLTAYFGDDAANWGEVTSTLGGRYGRHDGQGLGFVIRDELGRIIGVAAGYTWAGTSELKQMWIDESYRGRGYARALLNAFVAHAGSRGVRRIWVASYDFQAPGMYEKAGFKRMAEFREWPEGHINVVLCKTLSVDREN
jgi:ribosomal protein S18 acetylase RimI-like enzyme